MMDKELIFKALDLAVTDKELWNELKELFIRNIWKYQVGMHELKELLTPLFKLLKETEEMIK